MPLFKREWNGTDVKVGDAVTRYLAGVIPVPMKVTAVSADRIMCGNWTFDRKTGVEIDEELGWGPETGSGSFLSNNIPTQD